MSRQSDKWDRSNLRSFDRKIMRAAERGLDHLNKLFNDMWNNQVVPRAEAGDTTVFADWLAGLRRVIHVCPDKVTGFQIVLNDILQLDPDTWIRESASCPIGEPPQLDMFRKWIGRLRDNDLLEIVEGRIVITLPLPHDQTRAGRALLNQPVRNTLDQKHPPRLILWSIAHDAYPTSLVLGAAAIHSFRFTPYWNDFTPIPNSGTGPALRYWPSPIEWFLRFHGFKPLFAGGDPVPEWAHGRLGQAAYWSSNLYWHIPGATNEELKRLAAGHYVHVDRGEHPEFRLFRVHNQLCWPGGEPTPERVIQAFQKAHQEFPSQRGLEIIDSDPKIIEELMQFYVPERHWS